MKSSWGSRSGTGSKTSTYCEKQPARRTVKGRCHLCGKAFCRDLTKRRKSKILKNNILRLYTFTYMGGNGGILKIGLKCQFYKSQIIDKGPYINDVGVEVGGGGG